LDALKACVGDLTTQPLNPSRPLWQFHLFEDFETGRSALVARIHHCIADGIALISVMLSITDGGKSPPVRRRREAEEGGEHDWIADYLLKPAADLAVKAIGVYGAGLGKGVEMMADPTAPLSGSMEMARIGAQVVSDVAAMALMPDDSPTSLKGKATPGKRVAWGEPLPLAEVKAVGQALGGSINDVLLASVAGAIGSYLRDKGEDPAGKEIRAMVPVNLRPLEKAWQLGNRFGLVPLVLPIGIANPIDRLAAVRARMNELKGGYQPLLAFALLSVAGVLIRPVQHALLGLFAKKATAVMTNVPGPAVPLKICGRTLKQVMFWVPASGDIGMGVSILSYGGGVQFGLITDARMCPDPDEIVNRFRPEFDKLLWLAMMLPWER
jgi:diacylglycerol O-acyltransferase / wax synthase